MGELVQLHVGTVAPKVVTAMHQFEIELRDSLEKVKSANVPQGLIVALLHAHALQQTQQMIDDA